MITVKVLGPGYPICQRMVNDERNCDEEQMAYTGRIR